MDGFGVLRYNLNVSVKKMQIIYMDNDGDTLLIMQLITTSYFFFIIHERMNASSSEEVTLLPLNHKEVEHRSRSRRGFHVYLSRIFFDFKTQTDTQKRDELSSVSDGISQTCYESVVSIDSVDSIEVIKHIEVMRLACHRWRRLSEDMVNAWKKWAENLNRRPIPGRFYSLPPQVSDNLLENVLASMTLDWEKIVRI